LRQAEMIRDDGERAVSPVIATILMVAITVVLAGVLYVWANNLAAEGTDTTINTMNTYDADAASADPTSGTSDTLIRLQMTGKDTLSWTFTRIQLTVGDTVHKCGVAGEDACTISQQGGDDDNAWEPGEFVFLSESGTDICSDVGCNVGISVTYNGRTVAGDGGVSGQGDNVGGGTGGGGSGGSTGSEGCGDSTTSTVMFKDINPGSSGGHPGGFTVVGNTLYFSANDGTNGNELWKSDGTSAGTVMFKDINPGSSGSTPGGFTAIGNTLYFRANDDTHGRELWKSDGTSAGTVMVKDIDSGTCGQCGVTNDPFIAVGNTLYFVADDGTHGKELWKSDGTSAGTVMVKDINSDSSGSVTYDPFIAVGNTLYFIANDGTHGKELWKSDGTSAGTVMVKDINSGSSDSKPGLYAKLTAVGSTLYFSADDGTNGHELWKSDGTSSGTVMVKDIRSGYNDGIAGYGHQPTAIGNTLYFRANGGIHGFDLWKSDGTSSGTVMVKDIDSDDSHYPDRLTVVGNMLYFQGNDETNGVELWKSDGTSAGTVMVMDINPDPGSGSGPAGGPGGSSPHGMTAFGNTLYFSAEDSDDWPPPDGTTGMELYCHNLNF